LATNCTDDGPKRLTKQAIQYKPKVATTYTEFGHRQTTKQAQEYKTNVAKTFTKLRTNIRPNKHYNVNQIWLQHLQRMDTNSLPKQALQYKSKVATTCKENGHKETK